MQMPSATTTDGETRNGLSREFMLCPGPGPVAGWKGERLRGTEAFTAQRAQFIMFSVNHLRHAPVSSARNLSSIEIACVFHCCAVVNTPGSLASSADTLALSMIGLAFFSA